LKIAKRAHDLKELSRAEGKNTKKEKQKHFLSKLRKFKSLPNLRAIRDLTIERSKSKLDLNDQILLQDPKIVLISLDSLETSVSKNTTVLGL